ncbi:MAG: bifunctional 4-hydroxy-2-oxoglutarate aldolase/2-dehydro-3-deoxy-phosphogluconate aldolase [Flavipsychrobacter sp.]|nr:bifunctional 4-hydroxy-2-oxoglutarate aldolase/2-dehydro-3-deoxy-phosphogluconate aldolase [Flavipsychrobacter sp.]
MNLTSQISANKLIAIIRGVSPDQVLPIAEVLYEGGIRLVEVTMNSAEPLKVIEELAVKLGDRITIGAGTVLDIPAASDAIQAGARFILSPVWDEELIVETKKMGALSIPGAFTATEIYRAWKAGADLVKVFPALSPAYVKDIRGPLPQIPLIPTGGINLDNITEYAKAGAIGFGIGSSLVAANIAITDQYLAALKENASKFVQAVHS